MRRFINIFGLAMLGGSLALASSAVAGGHGNSSNHSNNNSHSNQNRSNQTQTNKLPQFQQSNKGAGGNKNGMGFIADPVRRPLNSNTSNNTLTNKLPKQGNFIADPVRRPLTNNTNPKAGNFIADPLHLKPNTLSTPLTGGATVRDHSVPKPVTGPQPQPRNPAITNGGFDAGYSTVTDFLGLDGSGFGFGFTAPTHPRDQVVDHRTPQPGHPGQSPYGNSPYGDHNGGKGGFTPSGNGPANHVPVKP